MQIDQNSCVIKIASSKLKPEALVKKIALENKGERVIQIFDKGNVINRIHLLSAYVNALESFKNKTHIAKSMSLEMLLFAAMTSQISVAIKRIGAKSNKEFVLFCNNREAYDSIKTLVASQKEFNPTKKESERVAKKFGITQANDLNLFILQKIALSRLED